MDETERRHATRYETTVPVSLSITAPIAPIEIEGKMVDYRSAGVLIVAAGHVDVISSIKNKGVSGSSGAGVSRRSPHNRVCDRLRGGLGGFRGNTDKRGSVATHGTPPGRA